MRVSVWDLEGPLSPTDYAAELAKIVGKKMNRDDFGKLFEMVSNYDDYLIENPDMVKELNIGGYEPGDTLRLLAPLYVKVLEKSEFMGAIEKTSILIPGASDLIAHLRKTGWETFIISTSYRPFALNIAKKLGIPEENVYCTSFDLEELKKKAIDPIDVGELFGEILQKFRKSGDEAIVDDLNDFFWKDRNTAWYNIMTDVVVRGGKRKAAALKEISEKIKVPISQMVVTGDSITDKDMLELASREGGIAISFNGNKYSIPHANVAITSRNLFAISILTDKITETGSIDAVWEIIHLWNEKDYESTEEIPKELIPEWIREYLLTKDFIPHIADLREKNDELINFIIKKQTEMRKWVRGWAGNLG